MGRANSSRFYLLAPNLYATSRTAWEYWESLPVNERRRYARATRAMRRVNRGPGPRRKQRRVR
jgi:hypothetical protein